MGTPAGEVWLFHPEGQDHIWFTGKHYEYYKDTVESEWAARKRSQDEQGGLKEQPLRGGGRKGAALSDFASSASACRKRGTSKAGWTAGSAKGAAFRVGVLDSPAGRVVNPDASPTAGPGLVVSQP